MRLVAFDFDGSLSTDDPFHALAEQAGVADEVAAVTEQALADDLSYTESLRERADLLAGLTDAEVTAAAAEVSLRPGAADLLSDLRRAGHHVAVLTGAPERVVRTVLDEAGVAVDSLVASRLQREDGRLTGTVEGPLVSGTKDRELERLAAELDLGMERTVAVGDGAVDLPMFEVVRLAVGFDPNPGVEAHCDELVASIAELDAVLEAHGVLPHGR